MSNGKYKSIGFQDANVEKLAETFRDEELVVTTDVAKETMYSGLADAHGEIERIVTWENTEQLVDFVEWIGRLQARRVVLVIEPSGTYGEPLRKQAEEAGWAVRLVSPKRLNDAAEVFDGVPSLHDAKASWLLAKLHAEGLSQPWGVEGTDTRTLNALIKAMVRHGEYKQQNLGRMEAEMARFWPEVTTLLDKDSATLLALLQEFGGPRGIAERPDEARQMIKRVSRGLVRPRKVDGLIESAAQTVGEPMVPAEERFLSDLAAQTDRLRKQERFWRRRVEEAAEDFEDVEALGEVVGPATAAVFRAKVGDFREFEGPGQLLKKFGLNLIEKSSGAYQGERKISKRGPGQARSYLYLATLRMIHGNRVFRAWHERKVERDAGLRSKSIVALMRKLVKGLWHVARGDTFDATKLFDTERLGLT